MLWFAILINWLHVFFAIFWFGGTLFLFAVVTPALKSSSPSAALEVGKNVGLRTTRLLGAVGGLTILFGLINAIAFGPVKSLDFLWTSQYGVTFVIAVVLAIAIAGLGARTGRVGMALSTAAESERSRLLAEITRLSGTSIVGFALVLICMVLMRHGI